MRASNQPGFRFIGMLAVLTLVLAACATAGSPAADGGGVSDLRGGGAPVGDEGSQGGEFGGEGRAPGSQPDGLFAPVEQRIIKTGEVSIEVANVGEALGRVRALAVELGGYVGGSQAGTLDQSATLTLRIPAPRFDEAIARLHELDGEVIAESTREQDVTGQVVDLEARIANLEASERSYQALLDRAEKIEDILSIQSRLDQVRGEIEQMRAQLKALEGQADLATLTATLVPEAEPVEATAAAWDPGAQFKEAVAALVGIGQVIVGGLIWFVVVWLPILLVLTIALVLALRGLIEVRRRMPAPAAAPASPEPPATS